MLSYFGRGNAVATGVIIVITLLNIVVYKLRQLYEENSGEELNLSSSSSLVSDQLCRRFSLGEILRATNNFDDSLVIGKGGFGKVYKGVIDNGLTSVAIKRLHPMSKQGAPEFWTEITMLSKFRHSHLVSLIGYCDIHDEMILVYEYMVNGTLADHMHKISKDGDKSSLSWVQRLKICIGAARGLDYLHTGTGIQHRVIHRDVKSANILLNENWAAKISDFGLSKIGPADQTCTHISTINVKGTFGYLDPEYFLTRRFTRKSDVYAFGVVLFEVLCERRAVDLSLDEEQSGLAQWAQQCIKEGTVEKLIGPSLKWQILPNSLMEFVQIAGQCLHNHPKKRPTMAEVMVRLEFALALQVTTDSSVIEGDILYTGRNFDKQENADSYPDDMQIDEIDGITQVSDSSNGKSLKKSMMTINKAGDSDKQENVDSYAEDGQVNEIILLGDLGGQQSLATPKMTFTRKMRLFFSVTAPKEVHSDANPSRNVDNTLSNKDGGLIQEVPVIGKIATPHLKIFSFDELRRATRNFRPNRVLAEGSFGQVYKGWVGEKMYAPSKVGMGKAIAIKRLRTSSLHGLEEWKMEIECSGKFSHPNLVKLLGYCSEDEEHLLVYEYMQKGSLANHLFRKSAESPPWVTRLKIAIGIARGLSFMHTADKQVIHRNIKTSNILLDGEFNAKLSSFALAKTGPANGESHISTRVMGTYGYACPEYVATGHLTVKSDVYGFGVVLLEILTGLRALDVNRPSGQHDLVNWVKPFLPDERKLKRIVDPRLEHDYPPIGPFLLAALTLKCIEVHPRKRPSMKEVLETLEEINAITKDKSTASGKHTVVQPQG